MPRSKRRHSIEPPKPISKGLHFWGRNAESRLLRLDATTTQTSRAARPLHPGEGVGCLRGICLWLLRRLKNPDLRPHFLQITSVLKRCALFLSAAIVLSSVAPLRAAESSLPWQVGPLFQEFSLTLSKGTRFEALGPLWSHQEKGNETEWAVAPAVSYRFDRSTDSQEIDFLYPLISYDRFGMEYRFHIFQWFAISGGENIGGGSRDRFQIFPFYFQQRSAEDPSRNYTALLPFYGSMRQKMFRDRIDFVLFPLYVETQKRDVITRNYLLPFFHLRRGDQLRGWQFWPLGGHEEKAAFSQTNSFDQLEVSPGHSKTFGLWPLYSSDRTGVGTDNEGTFVAIIPFGAWQRSPKRDSSTYLWPFFSFVEDREKGYKEWATPWPFVVTSRGKGKTGFRFWPLYGRAYNDSMENRTLLWPLWRNERSKASAIERERSRSMLFLYSDVKEKNVQANTIGRRVDFWPFYTWKREFDGSERLRALSLVEPFVPNNKSVERNYSPLWSIWRSERNAKTQESSVSVFWNLYRQATKPSSTKRTFLFGLYQCEGAGAHRTYRLFYVPLGKRPAEGHREAAGTPP